MAGMWPVQAVASGSRMIGICYLPSPVTPSGQSDGLYFHVSPRLG